MRSVQAALLGSGPATLPGDSFLLALDYEDGSLATITYASAGSPRMSKERVEVMGGERSAVIDDFRRVELHGGRRPRWARVPSGGVLSRRDKGHRALLRQAFRFFREGGEPPIPYRRMIETTRATLLARDALAAGDRDPVAVGE
jgi:predicted dehydrogenase